MKDIEFYKRAAVDAAFRQSQLEDLRYFKHVGAGLMWFCVGLGLAFSVYGGLTEKKWDLGFGLLGIGVLCASTYSVCATRLAALQALDDKKA